MSGITSGIGLISGIDTATLIDQLIAIERRPIDSLKTRVGALDAQRAAFLELSAQLLAVQNSILNLGRASSFKRFTAASTNGAVVSATAGESAAPGTHTFRVRSLVSNHSVISRGFADADATPVGVGSISFEFGRARVNRGTPLEILNGGAGVRRGVVSITDGSGASADIDLTTALTVQDVIDAVNNNADVGVRASVTSVTRDGVSGDRIVIEDVSGGPGSLTITDKGGGWAARDLGINASSTGGRIDGSDLLRMAASTSLGLLNDGNGVHRFRAGPDLSFSTNLGDFDVSLSSVLATQLDTDLRQLNSGNGVRLGTIRITDRTGNSAEVDLSSARTVRDVVTAINDADVSVSATVINSFFQIVDTSEIPEGATAASKLSIEDVTGHAAADLGLAQEVDGASMAGSTVFRVETIGDVINAINYARDNNSLVRASLSADGNAIELTALGLGNTLTVSQGVNESGETSSAARDLGLLQADGVASYRSANLLSGLNTVLLRSLRGGSGVNAGTVRLTDRSGGSTEIDFSSARTLQDVIDLINFDGTTNLEASINDRGNGITIRDASTAVGSIVIEDVSGSLATDLGIAGSVDSTTTDAVQGGNLQLQYIARATPRSALNAGAGVPDGTFRITDSTGAAHIVTTDSTLRTIGDIIDRINKATPDTIEARINDTGDGIAVTDTSGAALPLTIDDIDGGRTAAALRLAGTARNGSSMIDGSFEIRISVDADDTLNDVAKKINEANAGFSASVLHHGESANPFSLTITSDVSGRRGELLIDASEIGLNFQTLSRAQDAVITIGGSDGGSPIVVASSTNTLDNVVPGVTLNLLSVSAEPVSVTVNQDLDGITQSLSTFVEKFNAVMDTIDTNTRFNSETLARGPLLGDSTISTVRSRLTRAIVSPLQGVDSAFSRTFSVGLRLASGGRLEFDEERFREVYSQSPEQVEKLFTTEETGLAAVMKTVLDDLTRDFDGLISRKDDLLADQQGLLNDRIGGLELLLDAKRARLEAQFVALESTLATLQGQQQALSSLAQLAGGV